MDFDTTVKMEIYQTIVQTTQAPSAPAVARSLQRPVAEVQAAFLRLSEKRLLVLEPVDSSRIRMAPPFSGVETPHSVVMDGKSYFANCAWDALGVAVALHHDADIFSSCADCGEAMTFLVRDGTPLPQACAVHFAVPAAHWFDNIIHT